jgi:hypothetical protein
MHYVAIPTHIFEFATMSFSVSIEDDGKVSVASNEDIHPHVRDEVRQWCAENLGTHQFIDARKVSEEDFTGADWVIACESLSDVVAFKLCWY